MAYTKDIMDAVRASYIHEQLPLNQAAARHAVPEGTARRWKDAAKKNGDDWDKLKTAYVLAGEGLEAASRQVLMGFLVQHATVMEQLNSDTELSAMAKVEMLTSLSDGFNKTVSASRRVLPETNKLAVALGVIQDLAEYVQQTKPDVLGVFVELLDGFGGVVEAKYGK